MLLYLSWIYKRISLPFFRSRMTHIMPSNVLNWISKSFPWKLLGCSLKNQRHGVTSALSFLAATVLEGSSSPQPNNNFMKQAQHDLASLLWMRKITISIINWLPTRGLLRFLHQFKSANTVISEGTNILFHSIPLDPAQNTYLPRAYLQVETLFQFQCVIIEDDARSGDWGHDWPHVLNIN